MFRTLRGELLTYYRKRLLDPQEAEDYVQRTFERLLTKAEIHSPRGLIHVVAEGLLKNSYRDHERQPEQGSWEVAVGHDGTGLDHLPQFQTYTFEDSNFAAEFDRAVRVLDPSPRAAFILGELRGLPSRAAGPKLGVSHTTAAARRELATSSIRKELTHVQ
jgi:DNA-directed RNA polymerase specialized sigma24 family protein